MKDLEESEAGLDFLYLCVKERAAVGVVESEYFKAFRNQRLTLM